MGDDQALVELQMQLAFQEDTISQLNDVVTRQQRDIDELRQQFEYLKDKVREAAETQIDQGNTPPPHY